MPLCRRQGHIYLSSFTFFCWMWRFFSLFKRARRCFLSWAILISSTPFPVTQLHVNHQATSWFSSWWSLPFWCSEHSFVCICYLPHVCIVYSVLLAGIALIMFVSGKDKGKGKALPVQAMKAYVGSRDIACLIHKLKIRWRWLVSITPWALYRPGRNLRQHWKGGWVFLWSGLQILEKRNVK